MDTSLFRGLDGKKVFFLPIYLNEGRFVSYWHALNLVYELGGTEWLEIGPGNGLVSLILRQNGIKVTTLDVCAEVEPDVVADANALPFEDAAFDGVLCCEVLEHGSWTRFAPAMSEIRRVSRRGCVLSLPHCGKCWFMIARLPFVGAVWGSMRVPFQRRKNDFDVHPQHCWEVGGKESPDATVEATIRGAGFNIARRYRPGFNKDHVFYLLKT